MEYRSADKRYGLSISAKCAEVILRWCIRAGDRETGGILVGHYNSAYDSALVSIVFGPPSDSRSGRNRFIRGVKGLQKILDHLWTKRQEFYLGEWHFHPRGQASPSGRDEEQMRSIASSPLYQCPEPILLIVGGDPTTTWHARAFIAPSTEPMIELMPVI